MSFWRGFRAGLDPTCWTLAQRQLAEYAGWVLLELFIIMVTPWPWIMMSITCYGTLLYFRGRSHERRRRLEEAKKRMQPAINEIEAARRRRREHEERRWN